MRNAIYMLVAVVVMLLIVGDAFAFGRRCRGRGCSAGVSRPASGCSTGTCSASATAVNYLPAQAPASNCPGGVCPPQGQGTSGGFILR